MQTQPYALIRDLFIFRFQIQESDSSLTVWQKMEHGFGQVLGQTEETRRRAHLVGRLLALILADSPDLRGS